MAGRFNTIPIKKQHIFILGIDKMNLKFTCKWKRSAMILRILKSYTTVIIYYSASKLNLPTQNVKEDGVDGKKMSQGSREQSEKEPYICGHVILDKVALYRNKWHLLNG
jgi:hypothetical protein